MTRRLQWHMAAALAALVLALLAGTFLLRASAPMKLAPTQRTDGLFILPHPAQVTQFQLETHQGAPFQARDLAGKWSYLFFGFTRCPDMCPTTMAVLAEAEAQIKALPNGDDFRGLFVSVDPEHDDRSRIAAFLARFSDGFLGLRGDRSEISKVAKDVGVAFASVPDGMGGMTVEHSGHIVLIDPEGRYHGLVKQPHEAEKLVALFRRLTAA